MSAILSPASAAAAAAPDHIELKRVKAIFVGSVGNLVEWYDFYCYAAFSLYFSASFFPPSNPGVARVSSEARSVPGR